MLREHPVAGGHAPLDGEHPWLPLARCSDQARLVPNGSLVLAEQGVPRILSDVRKPAASPRIAENRTLGRFRSSPPTSQPFRCFPADRSAGIPLAPCGHAGAVHFAQGANMSKIRIRLLLAVTAILLLAVAQNLPAQLRGPRDPGVRGGPAGGGGPRDKLDPQDT